MKASKPAIELGSFPDAAADKAAKEEREGGFKYLHVRYGGLQLKPLTWADIYKAATGKADTNYPTGGSGAEKNKWLQHRLNELGYFCGALTDAKNDATRAALKRYTFAHPELTETDDETQGEVLNKLKASHDPRPHCQVEERRVFTGEAASTRVILESNYFASNEGPSFPLNAEVRRTENILGPNHPHGHAEVEAARLSGFQVPLQAAILLEGKDGKAVSAPEAVGAVTVEWHVIDPPEDTGSDVFVPRLTAGIPDSDQTRAKRYLEALHSGKRGLVDAQDNCPEDKGGVRPDAYDARAFFLQAGLAPLYAEDRGTKMITPAFADRVAKPKAAFLGTTGVLFAGSHVAGDNWIVKASLDFSTLTGNVAARVKKAHEHVKGLGDKLAEHPLSARTGTFTIWRRKRILRLIDWWGNTTNTKQPDWAVVQDIFRAAHIVLDPPRGQDCVGIDDILNGRSADYLREMTNAASGLALNLFTRRAAMTWRADAVIPLNYPWKPQGTTEFGPWTFENDGKSLIADFAGKGYSLYRVVGKFLRDLVGDPNGLLVVRYDHLPRPKLQDVRAKLTPTDQGKLDRGELQSFMRAPNPFDLAQDFPFYKQDPAPERSGGPSIGTDWGVCMLEARQYEVFEASFLFSHEMGHNMFLQHPVAEPDDHDKSDVNCAMYYPIETNLKAKGWGTRPGGGGVPIPSFCGKCLLKLRGWKVRGVGLPDNS